MNLDMIGEQPYLISSINMNVNLLFIVIATCYPSFNPPWIFISQYPSWHLQTAEGPEITNPHV